MARAGQICSQPGCPEPVAYRGRCRGHAAEHDARQKRTVPTKILGRGIEERQRRARAVAEHRRRFGNWCPGWGRAPHEATDLTAQHSHALALAGAPDQPLSALCRSCNSRHGLAVRRRLERAFG